MVIENLVIFINICNLKRADEINYLSTTDFSIRINTLALCMVILIKLFRPQQAPALFINGFFEISTLFLS